MKTNSILAAIFFLFMISCKNESIGLTVSNVDELNKALSEAEPGSTIVMANGEWKDAQIKFKGYGEEGKPIVLKAESAGKVILTGQSNLMFGGEYLEVQGLHFKDGFTPSKSVIEFRINEDTLANHCRLTNCVIEDYNQLKRDKQDLWVLFHGRHNQMDHCYLGGKANQGPTLRVSIAGNPSINNYHQIIHNHFGPRPRKGGPKAETVQIGDSYTSMSPSYTSVSNNLFERCNGEVEVISSKTNFNEFRNNVFYKCEGSVVTRHGNYCTVDGNYFIGDETRNIGGVRIINTGHWVTNNYFYSLRGTGFLSPLAIMNGIPKSPLNRYNQVTDAVIAYNTWVNCNSPWHFGIGSNIELKDVLPLSEIRSAIPKRTTVANNIIYNEVGDPNPIVEHDKLDGIAFKGNVISNAGVSSKEIEGLLNSELNANKITEEIYAPFVKDEDFKAFIGFDFDKINADLFGKNREKDNEIGAMASGNIADPNILNYGNYGPDWFDAHPAARKGKVVSVGSNELQNKLASAQDNDILELTDQEYKIPASLKINKSIVIRSKEGNKAKLVFVGNDANQPLFEMNPKGHLNLQNVNLAGKGNIAFAPLKDKMSSQYNLNVEACDIEGFGFVVKGYKESFANDITFKDCSIKNCENGVELSAETNNKGDYNVEFLSFINCTFEAVNQNVIDYYRGGYDESTIGGNLLVDNCKFEACGKMEKNKVLINTRGIINVNIQNSSFSNNPVSHVAFLWGAKNNNHSDNTIKNSGKITVEENLKQSLMY